MNWTLITGASAGFGEATAELLAKKGHNLWLVARREDRLQTLAKRLKGVEVRCSRLDVSDDEAVIAFGQHYDKDLSDVTVLVNNAGMAKGRSPIQDGNMKDWEAMIQTNVLGSLRILNLILPKMAERKRGHVINISSAAARFAYPGGNIYAASKSAVHMISQSMRMDLLGLGIRVSEISPGMAETEFSEVRFNDKEMAKKVYERMTPLTAQDIAETIAWCLDRPPHVNIQEIVMYPTDQASTSQVFRHPLK